MLRLYPVTGIIAFTGQLSNQCTSPSHDHSIPQGLKVCVEYEVYGHTVSSVVGFLCRSEYRDAVWQVIPFPAQGMTWDLRRVESRA